MWNSFHQFLNFLMHLFSVMLFIYDLHEEFMPRFSVNNAMDEFSEKSYACSFCDEEFLKKQLLEKHMKEHSKHKYFECIVCNEKFPRKKLLFDHMRTHTFSCPSCGKIFRNNSSLTIHIRFHTGEKPYKCDVCGKAFAVSSHWKDHLKLHTGEGPYECETCKKTFLCKSKLTAHMRLHSGENVFECDVCKRVCMYKSELEVHMRSHSGEKPYECGLCKKSFSGRGNLNVHIRSHLGEREFKCYICKVAFKKLEHLTVHKKTHSRDEEPYVCEVCGKRFISKGHVNRHMKIHYGEKQLKECACDICGRCFNQKKNLERHMPIHSIEKLFLCHVCGDRFRAKCYLDRHVKKRHQGNVMLRPTYDTRGEEYISDCNIKRGKIRIRKEEFICDICGRGFNQNKNLKRHATIHSLGKSFECHTCGDRFRAKCYLDRHIKKHHPVNMNMGSLVDPQPVIYLNKNACKTILKVRKNTESVKSALSSEHSGTGFLPSTANKLANSLDCGSHKTVLDVMGSLPFIAVEINDLHEGSSNLSILEKDPIESFPSEYDNCSSILGKDGKVSVLLKEEKLDTPEWENHNVHLEKDISSITSDKKITSECNNDQANFRGARFIDSDSSKLETKVF